MRPPNSPKRSILKSARRSLKGLILLLLLASGELGERGGIGWQLQRASAHDWRGQRLGLLAQYHLGEEALTLILTIPGPLLNELGGDAEGEARLMPVTPPSLASQRALWAQLEQRFRAENRVYADQDQLQPTMEKLDIILPLDPEEIDEEAPKAPAVGIHSGSEGAVLLQLRYPLPRSIPAQLRLQWTLNALRLDPNPRVRFRSPALARAQNRSRRVAFTPGLLIYGDDLLPLAFSEKEPEFVWHRPVEAAEPPRAVDLQSAPPPNQPLPAPSLLFVFFALLALLAALRARAEDTARARWRGAAGVALLIGAVMSWSWRPLPIAGWEEDTLSDERTREISEALLQKTYQAFSAESPEEVYDALSGAVSGALLDWTYQEIHQSLILREQGGAVAQVERVELLDWQRLPWEEAPAATERAFAAELRWRVRGLVDHWGHQHRRVNDYRARYEILYQPAGWRVVGLKIEDHRRRPELEFLTPSAPGEGP